MRDLYEEAHDAVARRVSKLVRAGKGDRFTAHQQRILLAQLRVGHRELLSRLAGDLSDASRDAATDSIRGLARNIAQLERHFRGAETVVPIDQAWKLRELVGKRSAALDTMHQRSMAHWGTRLFAEVHQATSLAAATGATTEEAIAMIPAVAAGEWWQGARIVRTELAWASNLAQVDGIEESARELDDMMKRWSEHVDDETGEPLDDRVGADSLALHGQIAEPGGLFGFPAVAPGLTPAEIARYQERAPWMAPPDRPNDRAAVQPWRPGWGIPGWRLVGGEKVYL
jgi:hypothetical protein